MNTVQKHARAAYDVWCITTGLERPGDPPPPTWDNLRATERACWITVADDMYQRFMNDLGFPPLANGTPRIMYVDDIVHVIVTEATPLQVIAIDNGCALRGVAVEPLTDDHPPSFRITAHRERAATHSIEEAGGLPMPPIPGADAAELPS